MVDTSFSQQDVRALQTQQKFSRIFDKQTDPYVVPYSHGGDDDDNNYNRRNSYHAGVGSGDDDDNNYNRRNNDRAGVVMVMMMTVTIIEETVVVMVVVMVMMMTVTVIEETVVVMVVVMVMMMTITTIRRNNDRAGVVVVLVMMMIRRMRVAVRMKRGGRGILSLTFIISVPQRGGPGFSPGSTRPQRCTLSPSRAEHWTECLVPRVGTKLMSVSGHAPKISTGNWKSGKSKGGFHEYLSKTDR